MTTRSQQAQRPRVVILTPVYNEEASLPQYAQSVATVLLDRTEYDFHVLFIEDGSADRSWEVICRICDKDARFQGLRLSRNYGSHIALSAGFAHVRGDAIATLACDLQDPPEVILQFLEKWRSGARIVWGHRQQRGDNPWRVWTSNAFSGLIRRFAMPRGSRFSTGSFLLVDKQVASCLRRFQEHNRTVFALVAWTGFEQAVVEYERKQRVTGKSGWTFSKMIKAMYDTFVGFSYLPIKLMTWLGVFAFLITVALSVYLVACWWTGNPAPGWTSVMLALGFFFGIQFFLMGVTGEYLSRIYTESVRRPLYFVSDTTKGAEFKGDNDD